MITRLRTRLFSVRHKGTTDGPTTVETPSVNTLVGATTTGEPFDEQSYLNANPDVAAAVTAGAFESGEVHWVMHGQREGRLLRPLRPRTDIVRESLNTGGRGIELGPLDQPIMAKREGFNVSIVDFMGTDDLRRHYGADENRGVNTSLIETVDYVSGGESLVELIGEKEAFDWVVASHVIEHMPDVVTFLQDIEQLLVPGGRLGLIIPDKRCCFDFHGELSSTGNVLDAFTQKRTMPSPGQVFDYFARTASLEGAIAWIGKPTVEPQLMYSLDFASSGFQRSLEGHSFDGEIHCWRFTPESFRLIISDLRAMGLVRLGVVAEHDTVGSEFFVTLGFVDDEPDTQHSRLDMIIDSRVSDRVDPSKQESLQRVSPQQALPQTNTPAANTTGSPPLRARIGAFARRLWEH